MRFSWLKPFIILVILLVIGELVYVYIREQDSYIDIGDEYIASSISTITGAGHNKLKIQKDRPALNLEKWNGEVSLGVAYDNVAGEAKRKFLSNIITWGDGPEEVHAYPLSADENMEDGGVEIEVILNERPETNIFEFPVTGYENLDFFYQPPLTQEEIDFGLSRPDNVAGSYAVFYKDHFDYTLGQMNYATGKAYHIYRPKAIDSAGAEVWAELSYSPGMLTVTVPQEFLDSAVYPVTVDPTFGYTSVGASEAFGGDIEGAHATAPANGTISSISFYSRGFFSSGTVGAAVYSDSSGSADAKLAEDSGNASFDTTATWRTVNIDASITANTEYWLLQWANSVDDYGIRYDTGAAHIGETKTGETFETWPGTLGGSATTRRSSIYATYTVANTAPFATIGTPSQASTSSVSFTVVVSDSDLDATSLAVQYSTDNSTWASTTLGTVTADVGTVSTAAGAITSIDTNTSTTTLTIAWNTGADLAGTADTSVYLRITPNDGTVDGTTQTSSAFTVDTTTPAVPTDVSADAGGSKVTLSWTSSAPTFISENTLGQGTINTSSSPAVFTGLACGTSYPFRVKAGNLTGQYSEFSDEVFARTSGCVGGGGGGGSAGVSTDPPPSPTPPAPTPAPTPTPTPTPNPPAATPTATPEPPPAPAPNTAAINTLTAITHPLAFASQGAVVKTLQQVLNDLGYIVAVSGNGSPGHETTYFGPLTRAALIRFQIANGIIKTSTSPGAGILGPKTRAAINQR